jgi:L-lactate dehydrogenase (cytochrome)
MSYRPASLSECHSLADLRALAERHLPRPVFDYMDGGAEDEVTERRNTTAFDADGLIPSCLVDVTSINTATRVFGQMLEWPVFCTPTGATRIYHPEGELAVARAAARAGTLYGLSIASTYSLEEVAAVSAGPKMLQLYLFKDRGVTRDLMERARRAGYKALCLTVDAAVRGKRQRELRTGLGIPLRLSMNTLRYFSPHPRWVLAQLRKGPLSMPHFAKVTGSNSLVAQARYIDAELDGSVTWKDVAGLIELWGGPFVLKGIMSVADARRAVDVGASAIIISNHGGRQLDGAAAAYTVLPEIAAAVGDRIELILDGGIRRGTHVLKALARGAKACSIGRPYLFGLGAGGEAGVDQALQILRTELSRAMQLCGCTDVSHVDPALVRRLERP